MKVEGNGGDPPNTPPYFSSSSSSSSSSGSSSLNKHSKKTHFDLPLLKIDVKFDFPMYDGEMDTEKLDNWINKLEVYCRIQKIVDENEKIQIASL
jgi:hypothetical protein